MPVTAPGPGESLMVRSSSFSTTALAHEAAAQASLQVRCSSTSSTPALAACALAAPSRDWRTMRRPLSRILPGSPFCGSPRCFEGRGRRIESPFLQSGRLSGTLTGLGARYVPNGVYDTAPQPTSDPPISRSSIRIGMLRSPPIVTSWFGWIRRSRHWASFRARWANWLLRGSRNVAITTYGGSAAYRVHPRVSASAPASRFSTFKLDSAFDRFFIPGFFAHRRSICSNQGRDRHSNRRRYGAGFAFGGLFKLLDKPASTRASLLKPGIVYRKAPDFRAPSHDQRTAPPLPHRRAAPFRRRTPSGSARRSGSPSLRRWPPEVTHLRYASLKDDFVDLQAVASAGAPTTIDNGTEVHAGFEFTCSALVARRPSASVPVTIPIMPSE